MSIDRHLIHTCEIQRPQTAKDGYNAEIKLWPPTIPTHLTGVFCRLVIKTQRVGETAFAERPVITTHRLLVPAGTDVRQGDRIVNVQDEEGVIDAGPFAIQEVMRRRASAERHRSLLLERTGQDGGSS